MRPLAVVLIWGVYLGLVQAYLSFARSVPRGEFATFQEASAEGEFSIEVSLTFAAAPDEFTGDPALRLSVNGKDLVERSQVIENDETLTIPAAEVVVVGPNEIFLQASSKPEFELVARAAQVRVLRDQHVLVARTIWAEPGEPLGGTIVVDVPAETHDHSDNGDEEK